MPSNYLNMRFYLQIIIVVINNDGFSCYALWVSICKRITSSRVIGGGGVGVNA